MNEEDLRDLDVMQLSDVLREHLPDEWLAYVDELERRYFQQWAAHIIETLRSECA